MIVRIDEWKRDRERRRATDVLEWAADLLEAAASDSDRAGRPAVAASHRGAARLLRSRTDAPPPEVTPDAAYRRWNRTVPSTVG